MVNAIDLRIGNWVDMPGKGFTQILDGASIDTATFNRAKPIPISADLLLALGFVKKTSRKYMILEKVVSLTI
jgi:hypothetical protein